MRALNARHRLPAWFPANVSSEQRQPPTRTSPRWSETQQRATLSGVITAPFIATPQGTTRGQRVVERKTALNGDREEGGPQAPTAPMKPRDHSSDRGIHHLGDLLVRKPLDVGVVDDSSCGIAFRASDLSIPGKVS